MLKKILLTLLIFFCALPMVKAEDKDWPVTSLQRSLTHENSWLNTSRPLTVEDLKGRIILVDFWTYCCINCMHIIPELQELEKTYGDKITIIGVHSAKFQNERDSANIRAAILRYGIEHPVVNDGNFYIWKKFGIHAWPTLMLINPGGRMEEIYTGEGNIDKIKTRIDDMLKSYHGLLNTAPLPISLEKNKQPKSVLNFPGKIIYVEEYNGGPALFVSDSGNNRILGIKPTGEIFLEIGSGKAGKKDGAIVTASFNSPQGLLYQDNILYVADTNNHLLRKIDLKEGQVETIAGTGEQGVNRNVSRLQGLTTALSSPWDLAFYPNENKIAIAMAGLHQIWTYDLDKHTLEVIAGNGNEDIRDGAYPLNSLAQTSGLSVKDNRLYFVDSETSSLRYLEEGQVKTLVGKGLFDFGFTIGDIDHALMQHPLGLYAGEKEVFVADSYNHSIRRFNLESGKLENYIGDGIKGDRLGDKETARFNEPNAITMGGGKMFITDTNNQAIKVFDEKTGEVSRLDVIPPAKDEEAQKEYQETLPNMQRLDFQKVAAEREIKVLLRLPNNLKINSEAPSWLSLFAVEGAKFRLVSSFGPGDIHENKIMLPKLIAEKSYKLQGTFYYCEKTPGAECYLKSIDKLIKAEGNARAGVIVIPLSNPR